MAETLAECGRRKPHPTHKWLRARRAIQCPGVPAPSGAGEAGPHRPGRPAEQVIADAISSVLVVPAETLAPLAERVADALGLPWPSGAGEAVLGEEALKVAAVRLETWWVEEHPEESTWSEIAEVAIAALQTPVAALVAAAEERGAADRERVARVQQAMAAAQATDHGVGVPQRCVWLGDLNHALDLTGGSS